MIFNVTIIDLFAYTVSNVNIALKNKRKISIRFPIQFVKCHKFTHKVADGNEM